MSNKKWFLTICLVGIFAFGAADTAIAADNTSIFWGKTKTMGNNLDGSTVKLTMGLLCRPATETPSQTSPWYPTESDLRVSAVNFQFINRPTEKIAVYESKSLFYIQSIY